MTRLYACALIALLLLPAARARCQGPAGKAIDSIIRLSSPRMFNGVVLISKNGKAVYSKRHGYSDLRRKTPLKPGSQFLVASVTKQFTAALVLKEMEAGRIDINQRISYYLPALQQAWADSVTIQQLLHHTSGVTGWDKPLAHTPGSKFLYSNINYAILGRVMEETSGRSYAALTATLFHQCGMASTTIPPGAGRANNCTSLVKGHNETEAGKYEETNILDLLDLPMVGIPAGGMVSTAADLAKWMYSLHNGKVLTPAAYAKMLTNGAARPHRWGAVAYADGVQADTIDGITEYSMSGYLPGFIATMIYYPASGVSMVVLENISPDAGDMNRAFYHHDEIRKIVRRTLL